MAHPERDPDGPFVLGNLFGAAKAPGLYRWCKTFQ